MEIDAGKAERRPADAAPSPELAAWDPEPEPSSEITSWDADPLPLPDLSSLDLEPDTPSRDTDQAASPESEAPWDPLGPDPVPASWDADRPSPPENALWDTDPSSGTDGVASAEAGTWDSINHALGMVVSPQDGLHLRMGYRPDVFDAPAARGILDRFVRVLGQFAADPDARVAELSVLAEGERSLLVERWNDTARPVPVGSLARLFEEQVRRTPDAVAVLGVQESLSYAQLDDAAARVGY